MCRIETLSVSRGAHQCISRKATSPLGGVACGFFKEARCPEREASFFYLFFTLPGPLGSRVASLSLEATLRIDDLFCLDDPTDQLVVSADDPITAGELRSGIQRWLTDKALAVNTWSSTCREEYLAASVAKMPEAEAEGFLFQITERRGVEYGNALRQRVSEVRTEVSGFLKRKFQ